MRLNQLVLGQALRTCRLVEFFLQQEISEQGAERKNHEQHTDRSKQSRHHRIAPAPTPGPLELTDGPGSNRLVMQEAAQIVRQLRSAGIAALGFLLQTLQ